MLYAATEFHSPHYNKVHRWIVKQKGRPSKCERCGLSDETKRYHWSNVSQKYLFELSDWQRLCIPCHWKYDVGDVCKRKLHSLTGSNLRIDPRNPNWRACKACAAIGRHNRWVNTHS